MRKKARTCICISIPEDLAGLLRRAAADDNRSVSSLMSALAQQYLEREGYLVQMQAEAIRGLRRRSPRQARLPL